MRVETIIRMEGATILWCRGVNSLWLSHGFHGSDTDQTDSFSDIRTNSANEPAFIFSIT